MEHLQDYYYRGHEVILIKDSNKTIIADIREDDYDGDLIAGMMGFKTRKEAKDWAEEYIDKFKEGLKILETIPY